MLLTLLAGIAQASARPYAKPPRLVWGEITSEDYPELALADDAEGLARVRIVIGTDGRIGECEVAFSTGNVLLDQASCDVPHARFVFDTARNAEGRPVAAVAIPPVRWKTRARERDPQ